jgi:hypothetical protein
MLNEQFSRMALYSHIDQPDLSWRTRVTEGTEKKSFSWRPACAKPLRRRQARGRQLKSFISAASTVKSCVRASYGLGIKFPKGRSL